jgi:hypothetical protein
VEEAPKFGTASVDVTANEKWPFAGLAGNGCLQSGQVLVEEALSSDCPQVDVAASLQNTYAVSWAVRTIEHLNVVRVLVVGCAIHYRSISPPVYSNGEELMVKSSDYSTPKNNA